jgi:hypothetical protein
MSSTSNAQALLVNVFRPTYRYDSNLGFVPSLTLSNVTEVITDKVITGNVSLTDSNLNTYVGCNAGNSNLAGNRENVAIGYGAMAGALNSSNNVAIGLNSLAAITSGDSNVGVGINTQTNGDKNIFIGPNITGTTGSNNIIIGTDINIGSKSNKFQLGRLLYGDLCSGFIGVNTADPSAAFDISGITIFRDKVGFQTSNPQYSLDVNGSIYASERFFGGSGTQANPLYSFLTASNTGMYQPQDVSYGSGAFGIAVNGQQAAVFASNQVYFFKNLNVAGTFSADSVILSGITAANGTAAAPSMTFSNDISSGMYLSSVSNLGFSTGGRNRLLLLSNGDVSLGRLVAADVSVSGAILSSSGSNSIGGVTLSNGFVITAGTTSSSNLLVPGYLRNADPATTLDISGGNISNSGLTRSSNFRAADGTVAVPTYSFTSDTSTGFYRVGANQLGFVTAGVQRMVFSNGELGIGTPTPQYLLDVSSATTSEGIRVWAPNAQVNVGDPAGGGTLQLYQNASGQTQGLFANGSLPMQFVHTNSRSLLVITSNSGAARIGIGTTVPQYNLDISGQGSAVVLGAVSGAASNDGLLIQGYSNAAFIRAQESNGTLQLGTGSVNRLSLTSVGVGVYVSPSYPLDVCGTIRTLSNFFGANGTVAVPTYSFTSDSSMGFYRVGASQLGFTTAGVQRMTFSNAVLAVGRTVIADPSLMIQTPANGYIATGRVYFGDAANSTPAYGGAIIEGLSNGGSGACDLLFYSRAAGVGAGSDPRERMRLVGSSGTLGIGTTVPNSNFNVDISGQGKGILIGAVAGAADNDGLLIRGFSNSGFIRARASNGTLYLGYSGTNFVGIGSSGMGVGVAAAYTLDVCGQPGTASVNTTSWTRSTGSTFLIWKGLSNFGSNTVNWTTTVQAIDSNLATVVQSNALGSSIRILRSGIWSVSWLAIYTTAATGFSLIDASTNNVSAFPSPFSVASILACETGAGTQTVSWTGYLPSNSGVFYKPKAITGVTDLSAMWHFQLTFHGESSIAASFP